VRTSHTLPPLGVYEVAYLAGGAERVVDTALVAMVETGRIRVHSAGQLAVVEPTRRHAVEAAVLDAVGTRGHRSVDVVRWRLADDDRISAVGRRLADEGLISRWSTVLRHRDRPPVRTAVGRRVLRSLQAAPPVDRASDGGSAVLVALHGHPRMTDTVLRAAIFEAFPTPSAKARAAGLRHRLDAVREYHPGGPVGGGGGGDGGGGGGGGGGS
jgi:hypothetical protein